MKIEDLQNAKLDDHVCFDPLERDDADYAEGTIQGISASKNCCIVQWDDGSISLVTDTDCDRIHLMTDDEIGISWWNGLMETERATWSSVAGNTGIAKDAWEAYKQAKRRNNLGK